MWEVLIPRYIFIINVYIFLVILRNLMLCFIIQWVDNFFEFSLKTKIVLIDDFFLCSACVCVSVCVVCVTVHVDIRGWLQESVLRYPHRLWRSHSGGQEWRQVPIHAEPSHWPMVGFTEVFKVEVQLTFLEFLDI